MREEKVKCIDQMQMLSNTGLLSGNKSKRSIIYPSSYISESGKKFRKEIDGMTKQEVQ